MKKFHQLIAKDIFNCLTEEEQTELNRICRQHGISEEAYAKMKQRVCSTELHREINSSPVPPPYLRKIFRYAAVFVLPLTLACYFLIKSDRPSTPPPSLAILNNGISEKPQRKAIQLILANGETIQLAREKKEVRVAPNILNTGEMLQYQKDTVPARQIVPSFNTIVVPPGGEFNLRLADGTQVWLNEKSRLKYPVEFNSESREIFLQEGEIYLEVAKDAGHPFMVHTSNGRIEVLGTHFNVRCVSSLHVETTLAEGKVKICQENNEVILHPGEQATVTDRISIAEVDVEEVICWKDNLFYFKDTELETILNKLAGWYDFEIFWQNPELKTKKFFMSIDKYASVEEILNKLSEVSEVCFQIDNRIVKVSK